MNSSAIERVVVQVDDRLNLRIRFRDGAPYGYADVSAQDLADLLAVVNDGESLGRFFNSRIRPAYPALRLTRIDQRAD